jgi:ABC-2 type transport system ATP-binding protein
MSYYAIRAQSLSRSFGNNRAVDQVNFEVDTGSVFGFLGPNGSGKTTTIRLLLGLLEPTSGHSEVLGWDPIKDGQLVRENCGALLEHTGLYERLTAMDNLDFYGRVWHMTKDDRTKRIQSLLEKVGLWDRKDEIVKGWSRGMKQKLAVARAMMHQPKVLFLDEPTAGLDPVASAVLRDDLSNLVQHEGVTVFLTTHNLNEAEKLCQRVAVIREGKLMMVGSPDELKLKNGAGFVEIVGSGFTPEILAELGSMPLVDSVIQKDQHIRVELKEGMESTTLIPLLVSRGVEIEEVRKGKASLEDVFLTMMEEANDK